MARKLISTLRRHYRPGRLAVGLSANQIGIHKAVCVFLFRGSPLVLVNPTLTPLSAVRIPYEEGCTSLPGVYCVCYRWPRVRVEAENLVSAHEFGPRDPGEWLDREILLRSVVCQHEIGHLAGKLTPDFKTDSYPLPEEWLLWRPEREVKTTSL